MTPTFDNFVESRLHQRVFWAKKNAKKNDFPQSYNFFTGLGWYGNFLSKPGFSVSGPIFNLSGGVPDGTKT